MPTTRPHAPPTTRRDYTATAVAAAMAGHTPHRLAIEGFRAAAVLVPLLEAATGLELLLTVRSAELRSHAGQIALPGGRLEQGESFVAAAIRETMEEIGVNVPASAVVGELSDHPSPAGYVARPIVALLPWPQPVTVDPSEVADVFTVPLAELRGLEPRSELRVLKDFRRRIYFYQWHDRNIWGFTGNVIKDLFDVLDGRDRGAGSTSDPFND
ncbi:MAG TPA: CoA pyrophosphatase [Trueperaceae bacterium]|nr:CoA pyrophosphatase [Trueperaceae bacterium]